MDVSNRIICHLPHNEEGITNKTQFESMSLAQVTATFGGWPQNLFSAEFNQIRMDEVRMGLAEPN